MSVEVILNQMSVLKKFNLDKFSQSFESYTELILSQNIKAIEHLLLFLTHLVLRKESLNSDGQQVHQFHNKMNNHLSSYLTEHKQDHYIIL